MGINLRLLNNGIRPAAPVIDQREAIQLVNESELSDIVCLTALPRDIEAAVPGRYAIHVQTRYPELWEHNPHIESHQLAPQEHVRSIQLHYDSPSLYLDYVQQHRITEHHQNFEDLEALPVFCTLPKGDLHFSEEERAQSSIDGRYWVVFLTCGDWMLFAQQLAHEKINIVSPPATTPLRAILKLILHADGVVTSTTFQMHVAAALDKPCVVIAKDQKRLLQNAYINFADKNTFGAHAALVKVPHRYITSTEQAVAAVFSYYDDGTLER